MNARCNVRVPVPRDMLNAMREKSRREAISLPDVTRILWRDWLAGRISIGTRIGPPCSPTPAEAVGEFSSGEQVERTQEVSAPRP